MHNVLRGFAGSCRILVLVLAFAALAGCGKDGNPAAPLARPTRVLVLGDGGTEDGVNQLLAAAGFSVTAGGPYWQYRGDGLAEQDAVLFLCGVNYGYDVPDSVESKLVDFVASGGGLIGTEWMMYNREYSAAMDILTSILPVEYGHQEQYTIETYRKRLPIHPVAAALPDSFQTTGDWASSDMVASTDPTKQAVTVFEASASGDAVVVGVHGAGRTAHWNMAGEYSGDGIWNANTRRLLANLVEYVRRR